LENTLLGKVRPAFGSGCTQPTIQVQNAITCVCIGGKKDSGVSHLKWRPKAFQWNTIPGFLSSFFGHGYETLASMPQESRQRWR